MSLLFHNDTDTLSFCVYNLPRRFTDSLGCITALRTQTYLLTYLLTCLFIKLFQILAIVRKVILLTKIRNTSVDCCNIASSLNDGIKWTNMEIARM